MRDFPPTPVSISSFPFGVEAKVDDRKRARLTLERLCGGSQKMGDQIGVQIKKECAGYFPLCAVIVLDVLASRGIVLASESDPVPSEEKW